MRFLFGRIGVLATVLSVCAVALLSIGILTRDEAPSPQTAPAPPVKESFDSDRVAVDAAPSANLPPRTSAPGPVVETPAQDTAGAAEVIQEIDESNLEEMRDAWDAAFEEISVKPEHFLRWRPVRVVPADLTTTTAEDEIEGRERIALTIFPGETLVATRTDFHVFAEESSMIWTGSLEGNEFATVTIDIVPEHDMDDLRASIHVVTRFQDFHVVPTNDSRFYVAAETYRQP